MQINNSKNHNNLTFDAGLNLRGNVRMLSSEQTDYLRKVASQIGTSTSDKIDMFVHTNNGKNVYSIIDIGGYINHRLKAANVSFTENEVYNGILNGLKFFISKMYNNEILNQFAKNPNPSEFDELKKFISDNELEVRNSEKQEYIHAGKLIIDGAIDKISYEEAEEIAEVVNAVAVNPRDKFYIFIKQGNEKDNYLINMAGYSHGVLKSALSDYRGDDVYTGIKNGVKFVFEKLLSGQLKKSAEQNLSSFEIEELNKMLKEKDIDLQI